MPTPDLRGRFNIAARQASMLLDLEIMGVNDAWFLDFSVPCSPVRSLPSSLEP